MLFNQLNKYKSELLDGLTNPENTNTNTFIGPK